MSGETETWRPGAEPWEALAEADRRYDNTPKPLFSRAYWEGIAARLSGMGWRLIPDARLRGLEERLRKTERNWWVGEHKQRNRAIGAEARVRELEAENERLQEERDLYRGKVKAAREIEERLTGEIKRLREALEAPEAKSHELSIPGVTEEWRRFWVRMDNGQLLFAESAPGDEQPSQAEYVEAFERARHQVESGETDAPASVPEPTGLRRGHLADLEVVEAILLSDPRERASRFDAEPRAMAEAVRAMIDDPELHDPGSFTHLSAASVPVPEEPELDTKPATTGIGSPAWSPEPSESASHVLCSACGHTHDLRDREAPSVIFGTEESCAEARRVLADDGGFEFPPPVPVPEALWRDLLVLLRLNDWPVTSEDSLAARDRLVRWVESGVAPVPVEEPEREEIECDRCGVAEVEGKYDLDDVEVTLCGRCAREVGRKTPLYRVAKAEAEPSPAPEIKERQVWRRKKDGYTARVKEIEGTTVWLVDVDDGSRVGTWFKSGLRTDWELVSEPEHSAPEIKVGQEPSTRQVTITLCELCERGYGGECHVPGCAFWMQTPPSGIRVEDSAPSLDLEGLAKLDAEIERLERARDEVEERGGFPLPQLLWEPDAYRQAREWLVKEGENGEADAR